MPTPRRSLGNAGEERARRLLEAKGYRYVESNWGCYYGEIDLVMRDGDELVFVEVKLRRGDDYGSAEESVSKGKQRKLLKTGAIYLAEHPGLGDPIWRIDFVAITLGRSGVVTQSNHIENAIVTG